MKNPLPSGYVYPICVLIIYAIMIYVSGTLYKHVELFIFAQAFLIVAIVIPRWDHRLGKKVGW